MCKSCVIVLYIDRLGYRLRVNCMVVDLYRTLGKGFMKVFREGVWVKASSRCSVRDDG